MPEKIKNNRPPRGLSRLMFRMPIWIYHAGFGWILGTRFVLLAHTGRNSGLLRQTVLEVVRHDKPSGNCIIASGWDNRSDWFKNVVANPQITFQVGNRRVAGTAKRLPTEAAARELLDYARRHPLAFGELANFMGYRLDGTDDDICAAGRMLPMFILRPAPQNS